jgi:2-isopropylmalate synthase
VTGEGNGPIAALVQGLQANLGISIEVLDYVEHAVSAGANASAVAYVEARSSDGTVTWGVGIDASILVASLKSVLSAVSRLGIIEP